MMENQICIKFHYNKGQISRATRTFVKPSLADRGDRLIFDPTMTDGYNVIFLYTIKDIKSEKGICASCFLR